MSTRVLTFHYELVNAKGEVLDSSLGDDPFSFLEGRKQIIPGLEEELLTMKPKDKKKVHIPAHKAYGPIRDHLIIKVTRDKLPEGAIEVGMQFQGGVEGVQIVFRVTQVEGEEIHMDGNHPLAGQDLIFNVELVDVREATSEELEHGHIHGPGGHDH